MAQNLTVQGAVSLPLVDGGTVAAINLAATLGLTSRADFCRSYSGAVTDDPIDFGTLTIPGAKGIIAEGDPKVLRDTSADPRVHQFFNRIMSKEAA